MGTLCIIHTTPTTVLSLKPLVAELLPGTACWNFMDDSILPEINKKGEITGAVVDRVMNLVRSAASLSPGAILFACSTIGGLAPQAEELAGLPVHRIDRPMCEAAVTGFSRIGVAATLASTLEPTCRLLEQVAAEQGKEIQLEQELVEGVNQLLGEGREEEYDDILSRRLMELKARCDVVVLAQASMARVLPRIPEEQDRYLTSPRSGLEALRCIL